LAASIVSASEEATFHAVGQVLLEADAAHIEQDIAQLDLLADRHVLLDHDTAIVRRHLHPRRG